MRRNFQNNPSHLIRKGFDWICLGIIAFALPTVRSEAEFIVLNRSIIAGSLPADELLGWPSAAAFVAGEVPSRSYGLRPGSSQVEIRFTTTDLGGRLLTLQATTGDDGTYDLYSWRDPYHFSDNDGSFLITHYNIGGTVAITVDPAGRVFLVEEIGGTAGDRTYRIKRWDTVALFSTYAPPAIEGTRQHVPDLKGVEFIDGLLYGLFPVVIGAEPGYEVRHWADFSDFLTNSGTLDGQRADSRTFAELLAPDHAQTPPVGAPVRHPLWPWMGNKFPTATPGTTGNLNVIDAFPNLTFQDPIKMVPRPGSPNELWVIGREGHIWSFIDNPATSVKTTVLDLSANTLGWDDCGILGIAFHPEFGQSASPNRGYVYVAYNFLPSGDDGSSGRSYNRLSRFTLADGASVINPASEFVLINQFDEHQWHNQGDMFFDSDGYLLIGLGDEGDADNSLGNAQHIDGGLFSGVLRIDVDQDPARSHPIRRQPAAGGTPPLGWPATYSQGYGIPNDNPWLDLSGSILEEFWAIGLRNPFRMSQDPATGQTFIGDVGQNDEEEVNVLAKGANYQWAFMEGTAVGPDPVPSTLIGNSTAPYWRYPHQDSNRCVIGGHVYRGSEFDTQFGGEYVFGDFVSGHIWSMRWQGHPVPEVRQIATTTGYSLSGFGLDHNNEIYLMALGSEGHILKLSAQPAPQPPATLSATGAFADLATLTPAPGVLPYTVNAPLWSDNALKQRWIAVPGTNDPNAPEERVVFHAESEWEYPVGTVLIKHFELATNEQNPAIRTRLETRFTVKSKDGSWYGVTYKWRPDGSDADLLLDGLIENVTITTASGGTRTQPWTYPSRTECLQCHNNASTQVLGLRTWQLNGTFTYPGTVSPANQIQTWSDIGMFDQTLTVGQISGMMKAVSIQDASAPLETRVRSYIDSNCAHCHRPGGAQALMDARFNTPLAAQNIINGAVSNNLGIPGAHEVTPGSLAQSIMHVRVGSLGVEKMPPLAKSLVDTAALAIIDQWIKNIIPPSPPLTPSAVAMGYTSIQLSWAPGSTNEDEFIIERSFDGANWTPVGNSPAASSGYTDTGLDVGTTYHYRISARNQNGTSTPSPTVTASTWPQPGSWADWQRLHPLAAMNAPLQNPDGDSCVNLLEFALGSDPSSGGSAQNGFSVVWNGSTSSFDAVLTRPQGLSGVTMTLVVAPDLAPAMAWSEAGIAPSVVTHPDGTETLTVAGIDALPGYASSGHGLVRLRVVLNSSGESTATETWYWEQHTFDTGIRSFGLALLNQESFSGTVTSGSTMLDVASSSGSRSVKDQFDPAVPAYIEVIDGTYVGHRFDINVAGSTSTGLALEAGSPRNTLAVIPDLSGSHFIARRHATLATTFPVTVWYATLSSATADRVMFYDAANAAWTTYWLAALPGGSSWLLQGIADITDQGGHVIAPGAGALVRRGGAALSVPLVGIVRANAFGLPTNTATHFLAGGWPLEQSPSQRAMLLSDGFTGSQQLATADRILLWRQDTDAGAALNYQTFFLLNATTPLKYWTTAGDTQLPNFDNTPIFRSQTGFFLQLKNSQPNWILPLPWQP